MNNTNPQNPGFSMSSGTFNGNLTNGDNHGTMSYTSNESQNQDYVDTAR